MDKHLEIHIITPDKEVYSGKAESITLPGSKSTFQVLYNHAPIVSSLEIGNIKIVTDKGEEQIFQSGKGMIELKNNIVSVIVESID